MGALASAVLGIWCHSPTAKPLRHAGIDSSPASLPPWPLVPASLGPEPASEAPASATEVPASVPVPPPPVPLVAPGSAIRFLEMMSSSYHV